MDKKVFCIMTRQHQRKNPLTKTTWINTETETKELTEEQYNNFVDAAPFFRRLGGSVTQTKEYTGHGYIVTRDITTDPWKKTRSINTFKFV